MLRFFRPKKSVHQATNFLYELCRNNKELENLDYSQKQFHNPSKPP